MGPGPTLEFDLPDHGVDQPTWLQRGPGASSGGPGLHGDLVFETGEANRDTAGNGCPSTVVAKVADENLFPARGQRFGELQ